MTRIIGSSRARWISMMALVWTFAGWYAGAMSQEGSPPVPPVDAIPRRPSRLRMPSKSYSIASGKWSNVSIR
jgi:hypothetical protein